MARLLVHVEGQTEENFVNRVLRVHLVEKGYHSVDARIVGNVRQRGGIRSWTSVRKDIVNHLRGDRGCIATTMVDYYGLPQKSGGAWPGRAFSTSLKTIEDKALWVEDALREDLAAEVESFSGAKRFVPFIVMHEFEGLLFSDCAAFSESIGRPDLKARLQEIRDEFATPEEINDSPDGAPSKPVGALAPRYQKPLDGVQALIEIGLARIREECPHFDGWVKQLESLVAQG